MKRALFFVLLTGWIIVPRAASAQAAPQTDACSALEAAIEHGLKLIASDDAKSLGDNSAPRATLSQLKINNQTLLISMHLQLMRDNSCPKRKEPIRLGTYMLPALECENALLQLRLGKEVPTIEGSSLPAACDMTKWKLIKGGSASNAPKEP